MQESQRPRLRDRIVFLEDYDMHVARYLVQGADVWLNVPRRPLEASGTSGMKAAVNGGLNLSVLDGWWAEGYSPESGWAIGSGEQYEDPEENDAVEAEALYTLLEREVIPAFYSRDSSGRPREWTTMMTASIRNARRPRSAPAAWCATTPSARTCRPTARPSALAAGKGKGAVEMARWRERMAAAWPEVSVRSEIARQRLGRRGHRPGGRGRRDPRLAHHRRRRASRWWPARRTARAAWSPRRVVEGIHEGAAGAEQRFLAVVPAAESGRLAVAARVVPLRPDGAAPSRAS